MFDFENPFDENTDVAEKSAPIEEAAPDWENADWEDVCNNPQHQAEGRRRVAERDAFKAESDKEKQEMFENFHEDRWQHRLERMQIDAARYGLAAVLAGVLAYITGTHGISWLAWLLGITGGALAIISSFGFGIVREMNR